MKSGETRFVVKKLDLKDEGYNSVAFRLSNGKTTIKKSTDAQDTKDKVLVQDGVFLIPLQQTDTQALEGNVTLEAQINYENHSVRKSDDNFMFVGSTLGTDIVQGSEPAQDDGIEVVMTAIEEGVAVIVNPEASQELIDAVTDLFQDTKQIAQSVRDDADAGEFDGEDGYSPQVTVKTETPTTYILHIKDADHEFDTPNLQGQGGEGSLEVGDGLQRVGNVISVKRKQNGYILVTEDGLYIDVSGIAYNELLRGNLTMGDGALASKSYADSLAQALGNALSVSIDSQTYVMTLQLKHDNTVLSTGTVDLPLESVVVSGYYDAQTKEVVLTLQSGSTIRFSVADLVSGLVSIDTFNSGMATKVDKVQSENNELTLTDNTETSEISVGDYSFLSFDTSHLENDDVLTMYYKIGNTWDSKTISHDSWYEYVYNYDAIKFKVVTTPSSETREFKYSLYNEVIRQRQYSREIGAFNNELAKKVSKFERTNTIELQRTIKSERIIVSDWSVLYGIKCDDFPSGASLIIYPQDRNGNELEPIDITSLVNTAQVKTISQYSGFKFFYGGSASSIEIEYSLANDVVRQRQLYWDLTDGLATKQDTIDSTHKLSADNVDDTNATNKFVPTSTSADNGKFLRVVNGVATWQTVPQAESNSF